MATRTDAYVDTSALIAALDRADSHHALYRQLFAEPPRLVTSALVIAEGHAWFLRRYDSRRAIQFLSFFGQLKPIEVVPFGEHELGEAGLLVRKYADQALSLADAHGLAIMNKRRITVCWSTDRHLGLTGAVLVV